MATPSTSAFLTEGHYKNLLAAQDRLALIQKEITLAIQAGIDATALQKERDDLDAKIRLFKTTYFPGRI